MENHDQTRDDGLIDLAAQPMSPPARSSGAAFSVARPLLALPLLAGIVVLELWGLTSSGGGPAGVPGPSPISAASKPAVEVPGDIARPLTLAAPQTLLSGDDPVPPAMPAEPPAAPSAPAPVTPPLAALDPAPAAPVAPSFPTDKPPPPARQALHRDITEALDILAKLP